MRAHFVEDARVEAAEADLVAVRLDRGARSLEQLGREGLAEGAVVAVELDDPNGLRTRQNHVTCPCEQERERPRRAAAAGAAFSMRQSLLKEDLGPRLLINLRFD